MAKLESSRTTEKSPIAQPVAPNVTNELETIVVEHTTVTGNHEQSHLLATDDLLEINSSPTKVATTTHDLSHIQRADPLLSSSPTKRKCVLFSDDLVSEIPLVPIAANVNTILSPKKSILKFNHDEMTTETPYQPFEPGNESFWTSGMIIKYPMDEETVRTLIRGCLTVLKNPDFEFRFEAYATLSSNIKHNNGITINRMLTLSTTDPSPEIRLDTSLIEALPSVIHRDIVKLESNITETETNNNESLQINGNPFSNRIIGVGLKLMDYFLSSRIHVDIPIDELLWFCDHACQLIIKPNIPKSLVVPYLNIIKNFPFDKGGIFRDNSSKVDISKRLSQALLHMKHITSGSVMKERMIAYNNLVTFVREAVRSTFNDWFEDVITNLFTLRLSSLKNCMLSYIMSFIEASIPLVDHCTVRDTAKQVLLKPIFPLLKNEQNSLHNDKSFDTNLSFLAATLNVWIEKKYYKEAMNAWSFFTVLYGGLVWEEFDPWLAVLNNCLKIKKAKAQEAAILSWKAIAYNVNEFCNNGLAFLKYNNCVCNSYKHIYRHSCLSMAALLERIEFLLDVLDMDVNYLDTIHQSILSIMFNCSRSQPIIFDFSLIDDIVLEFKWHKIVVPCFERFYFHKNATGPRKLWGFEILNKLFKELKYIKIYHFRDSDSLKEIAVSCIADLNSEWCSKHQRQIFRLIDLACLQTEVECKHKVSLLSSFCSLLKRETFQSCEVIPRVYKTLKTIFKSPVISNDDITNIFIMLVDVFGSNKLCNAHANKYDFYDIIALKVVKRDFADISKVVKVLFQTIDKTDYLPLLLKLYQYGSLNSLLLQMLSQYAASCKVPLRSSFNVKLAVDLIIENVPLFAVIFKNMFEELIQVPVNDFDEVMYQLCPSRWSIFMLQELLEITQNVTQKHITTKVNRICSERMKHDPAVFMPLVMFMLDQGMYDVISDIYGDLNEIYRFEFAKAWKSHSKEVASDELKYKRLMMYCKDHPKILELLSYPGDKRALKSDAHDSNESNKRQKSDSESV